MSELATIDDKAIIEMTDVVEQKPQDVSDEPSYTPQEERRVRRKMDLYMLPVLCFMNICAYLDKANIGNANVAGMSKNLELSTSQYNLLLTIFYVVYTCFQWEMIMLKYIPPRYWLTGIVFAWGLASTCQGFTSSFGGMIACRSIVAALEAGGGPAIAFYFTMLYPRREFGLRYSIFMASSCIANAFAGAMAYGLVQAKTSLVPWKLVFIVESTPTFLCALLILIIVPSAPDKCIFLSARENEIARERIERSLITEDHTGYRWVEIKSALAEPWTWWIAVIHFFGSAAFASLSVFLTAIINEMGFGSIKAQGMSAPPWIFAFIVAVTVAYCSDRFSVRGWFIAAGNVIGGVGYILIAFVSNVGVRYFATYVTVAGVYVAQPLMFSWCATNSETSSKRATSLVAFLVAGQLGSIMGTNVYNDPPTYIKGNTVTAGGLFFASLVSVSGRLYLQWRNKKRDEKYGPAEDHMHEQAPADGSEHPGWRFVM